MLIKMFRSFFISFLLLLLQQNGSAQKLIKDSADTYRLLWYTGKKKNDTSLILSDGTVVSFSERSSQVSVQLPKKDDEFEPVKEELDKTDQKEQQAKSVLLSGNDAVVNYPLYDATQKAYEHEKAAYKEATSSKIDVPESGVTPEQKANQNFLNNMLNDACPKNKVKYDDLMSYYNQHKGEKTFDLPAPPSMDYDHCWSCDSGKQKEYDTLVAHYQKDLFKEETEKIIFAIGLIRDMALIGFGPEGGGYSSSDPFGQTVDQMLGSKKHPTTCTWLYDASANLPKVTDFLFHRVFYKAQSLFKQYKGDEHNLTAIIKIYLNATREMILFSGNTTTEDPVLKDVGNVMYNFFVKYRERVFIKHDFTQLPNIKFLCSLARECALLGYDKDPLVNNFCEDLIRYDRFKLSFDIDAKEGENGVYMLAHLKGDNYIRAVPDDSLCMRWVLIESNDPKRYLKLNLVAADVIAPPEARPTYAGTHDWQTMAPDTRFHFCEEGGKDTIIVHGIFPVGFKEPWIYPHIGSIEAGVVKSLLFGCFLDREHLQESESEATANEDEMKKEIQKKGEDMQKMMAQMKAGKTSAGQMQTYSKMMQMGNDMQQTFTKYVPRSIGNFFFEVPVQSGSAMMIDATIDGKKLFPDNPAIVYANFKLQLKQDPK